MFWLVLGMTIAVALAAFVVGIVALPARRAGRPMFTERGERVFRVSRPDAPSGGAPDKTTNVGEGKAGAKRFR